MVNRGLSSVMALPYIKQEPTKRLFFAPQQHLGALHEHVERVS